MTQVKMPEPVGYLYQTGKFRTVDLKLFEDIPYNTTVKGVITITQAEAYADARVREALEGAAKICWEMQSAPEFGKDDKDRWLAIAESRIRSMIKE